MRKNSDAVNKKITQMQELADMAGVSRATVSRALSGSPLVNEKTKAKVRKLAEKYNYQVNEKARNFRLQKTNIISVAFMLDIKSEQHMSDPFFLEILGGIADCLAEHDYDLLLAHAPIPNILDLPNGRLYRQSDGIIFVGQSDQNERLNQLSQHPTPLVVWGAELPARSYCLVGGDNVHGGYLATKHLLDAGRKRIAFFGNVNLPEPKLRYSGYKKALKESGLRIEKQLQVNVPFEMHHALDAINEFLRRNAKFDAIVCCSDLMALSAIAALNARGLRVPDDIAVTGYDDIGVAAHSSPALTTVRQSIHEAGRVLAESLLKIIGGENVTDTILPAELVVRRSSGIVLPAGIDGSQI